MVTGLWYTYDPNFGSLSWFWRCKEHPCPLSPHLGLWRTLEVSDWGLASWPWFGYDHWSLLSIVILKVQRISMSFKSSFGSWRSMQAPDLGLALWSWFWYCHWSLIHPCSEFWLSILILKVQRTSVSFKSWFGAYSMLEFLNGVWDHDHKLQTERFSILQSPKSAFKGHGSSLDLENKNVEPKFRTWVYQRLVTISKSDSRC